MKTIKESILSSTNSGSVAVKRKLAEKLAEKFERAKNSVGKWSYDNLGHKLEEYDIIITINTTISDIGIITQLQDPDDEECILVYIPKSDIEISMYPHNVIKLDDPEKLLKL